MSDHIPFDLQEEIIKKLPTESLLKFRTVSKPWKCLIDSAKFIADYNPRSEHVFIHSVGIDHYTYNPSQYDPKYEYQHNCVNILDDATFPQHKFSVAVPSSCVNMYRYVIGYSQGLFCLFGHNPDTPGKYIYVAVIWNPSIRKSVDIVVPNFSKNYVLGFGVCRNTNDPKIVKIKKVRTSTEMKYVNYCPWDVEVFAVSEKAWRRPLSKLPNNWFDIIFGKSVVIDGFIYWFAFERINMNGDGFSTIIGFDLTSEEFSQVYLLDKLPREDDKFLGDGPIFKLWESLAVVKSKLIAEKQVYNVWLMENGVSKSFTKVFTINLPYASLRTILGFRKNGGIIMETRDNDHDPVMLVCHEPGSKHINRLGISENQRGTFFVSSYEESLLLHDQPNMHMN